MLKLYVTDTNVAPIINGVRPPMPWDVYLFVVMLTVVGWITDVIMVRVSSSNESRCMI